MNRPTAGAGALAVLLLAACGGTTGPGGAAGTMDTSATGTGAATTGTAGTGTAIARRWRDARQRALTSGPAE